MDARLCEHYFAALCFAARHYFVFVANDCPVLDAGYRCFFLVPHLSFSEVCFLFFVCHVAEELQKTKAAILDPG